MKIDAVFRFQSFPTFSTIASCNLHIENLSTRKLHTANGKRENGRGTAVTAVPDGRVVSEKGRVRL